MQIVAVFISNLIIMKILQQKQNLSLLELCTLYYATGFNSFSNFASKTLSMININD